MERGVPDTLDESVAPGNLMRLPRAPELLRRQDPPAELARVGFELGPCLDQRMSCPTLDVQRGLRRKTARRFFDQHSSVASVQTGRSAPKLTIDIRSAAMPFEIR